jgi:hypothetical protein
MRAIFVEPAVPEGFGGYFVTFTVLWVLRKRPRKTRSRKPL